MIGNYIFALCHVHPTSQDVGLQLPCPSCPKCPKCPKCPTRGQANQRQNYGNYTVNLPSWFPTAEGCQVVFPAKHTKHAKKVCITPATCGRKVRTSVRPAVVWKAMLSAAAIPHGLARHCVPRRCQAPRAVLSMPVKTPDAQRTAECPGRDGRKAIFRAVDGGAPARAKHGGFTGPIKFLSCLSCVSREMALGKSTV